MDRRFTILVGIGLVFVGAIILFSEYGFPFRLRMSWPVILLVIGGAMIVAYLTSKPRKNLLFGGSVVFWLGIFFLLMENLLRQTYGYGRLWPGFIIVLGLAHLTTAVLNPAMKRQMTAAVAFIALGVVLLFFTIRGWRDISFHGLLVILGLVVIILGLKLIIQFMTGTGEKEA